MRSLKHTTVLVSACLLSASAPSSAAGERTAWLIRTSPHFTIHYGSPWTSGATPAELELIYGRLQMDITLFSPQLLKKKIKVYIYKDREAYLNGEFKPDKDTGGMAYVRDRTIVTYDPDNIGEFREIFAHEITHLYFEGFFGARLNELPRWLDEGMAAATGDMARGAKGPWMRNLERVPMERIAPLKEFFGSDYKALDPGDERFYWYLQSFGVVSWLFRPAARLQFKMFCALIRRGERTEQALWKAYRVKNPAALDRIWLDWLKDLRNKEGRGPADAGGFRPVQVSFWGSDGRFARPFIRPAAP